MYNCNERLLTPSSCSSFFLLPPWRTWIKMAKVESSLSSHHTRGVQKPSYVKISPHCRPIKRQLRRTLQVHHYNDRIEYFIQNQHRHRFPTLQCCSPWGHWNRRGWGSRLHKKRCSPAWEVGRSWTLIIMTDWAPEKLMCGSPSNALMNRVSTGRNIAAQALGSSPKKSWDEQGGAPNRISRLQAWQMVWSN